MNDTERFTKGPWVAHCRASNYAGGFWGDDEFLQWHVKGPSVPMGRGDYHQGDALLIAHAPNLYAELKRVDPHNPVLAMVRGEIASPCVAVNCNRQWWDENELAPTKQESPQP